VVCRKDKVGEKRSLFVVTSLPLLLLKGASLWAMAFCGFTVSYAEAGNRLMIMHAEAEAHRLPYQL
jgi:hypothetical protein